MDKSNLSKKWLEGTLTPLEKEQFEKSKDFSLASEIIENATRFSASHQVKAESYEEFKATLDRNTEKPVKRLTWLRPAINIAAVLVVALGIFFLINNNDNQVVTQVALTHKTVTLPDNSIVSINSQSNIAFNKDSWSTNREVTLEGEAFFDVEKGANFEVKTTQGTVTVLGTEFNVKQRGSYFEVMCFEGLVAVEHNGTSIKLPAGNYYRFENDQITQGAHTITSKLWNDASSTFMNTSIFQVANELGRQFDKKIVFDRNVNMERTFTGVFMHNNLEKALEAITIPLGLTFKTTKNDIIIYEKP